MPLTAELRDALIERAVEVRRLIESVEVVRRNLTVGDGTQEHIYKVKLISKSKMHEVDQPRRDQVPWVCPARFVRKTKTWRIDPPHLMADSTRITFSSSSVGMFMVCHPSRKTECPVCDSCSACFCRKSAIRGYCARMIACISSVGAFATDDTHVKRISSGARPDAFAV